MNEVECAAIVPVLRRPHRVAPLLESFAASSPSCRVLFVADRDDRREIAALRDAGAECIAPGGNYASKIHAGIRATSEPLIFTAADDLEPEPGWLEAAAEMFRGGIEVVGVNDLIPRDREHATHFVMTRRYAETPTIDGRAGPLHQGYHHWFCDDELIATAKTRGAYAYCPEARVRHLHPMTNDAPDDATYRKGRRRRRVDQRLFQERSALWT